MHNVMKKLIYLSKAMEEGSGEIQDCGHNKTDIIQGPIAYLHNVYIFQRMIWRLRRVLSTVSACVIGE